MLRRAPFPSAGFSHVDGDGSDDDLPGPGLTHSILRAAPSIASGAQGSDRTCWGSHAGTKRTAPPCWTRPGLRTMLPTSPPHAHRAPESSAAPGLAHCGAARVLGLPTSRGRDTLRGRPAVPAFPHRSLFRSSRSPVADPASAGGLQGRLGRRSAIVHAPKVH